MKEVLIQGIIILIFMIMIKAYEENIMILMYQ